MVEYFGKQLSGFAFTANGWVQSYGSRCVKPPIIYGDVSRPKSMTVFWSSMAQEMTKRPMKGMLTGPVTILNWSFVRNDQPRYKTCYQIVLAIKEEVQDLEKAGIKMIQLQGYYYLLTGFNYSTSFGNQTCNRIQLQHNSITTVFNYSRIQLHSSALQPTKRGLSISFSKIRNINGIR
ncbi:hypothetical protein LXL04_025603 [Taraxacum kok-saghyz]